MESQMDTQKDVMSQLIDFFEKMGLKTSSSLLGNNTLSVLDKREEDWSVIYTFKLVDSGKTMEILSFTVNTPIIALTQNGNLYLTVNDENGEEEMLTLTLRNVRPIHHTVNEFLLKMLAERPVHFLVYTTLIGRLELSFDYVDKLADKLWEYHANLNREQYNALRYYAEKLG